MRLIFTILAISLLSFNLAAQRVDCPNDLVLYPLEKTTTVGDPPISMIDTLDLDPLLTSGVSQFYEAPQDIVVSGARFYAYKTDLTGGDTVRVTVELRRSNIDSLPTGPVLASQEILIQTPVSYTAPLATYQYNVNWTPVVMDEPYILTITYNPAGTGVTFLHNHLDGVNSDGAQEWLSGIRQGTSWLRSYDYIVNAQPFDADFFILPFVDYDLNASFINDPECLFDELGDTVDFFNDGSQIVDSRMYNSDVFQNIGTPQEWEFGDGSTNLFIPNPSHFYPSNGPFAATFTAKLTNWGGQVCENSATQVIKEQPEQDFDYITDNLEVTFENKTLGLYTDIKYFYGDGQSSSNQEDPVHKYGQPGTYWVCQQMETSCGIIEHCENVAVATNTALNCGKDTVKYTLARATHIPTIPLKNTNPNRLQGVGQRFDVSQPLIVHGFTFYATHEGLFRDHYAVDCRIWDQGQNGLPEGEALATSVVRINKVEVDSNYSDSVRYTAIFDKPVNVTEDYVLTLEYDSNVVIRVSLNGYEQQDGQGDLNAIGKINDSVWVSSASVSVFNINGFAVNADLIFEPIVEYNLDANFIYTKECLDMRDGQETQTFVNLSSSIVRDDVYNQIPFNGSSVQAFEWDMGDSAGIVNQINPTYNFQGTGPFDVTLKIIMEGWTNYCESTQTLNVPVFPTGGFGFDQITSQVIFYDSSFNADEVLWAFDDGTFSTLSSPTHYFTSIGEFEVCQYVSNICGSDTICTTIGISVVGLPESITEELKVFPNPATDIINIQASDLSVKELKLTLYDLSGREVRSYSSVGGYINHQWYIGDLARGSYMMKINADGAEGTRMLMLSR